MTTTQPIVSVLPYRTDDHLDRQLAAIGYAATYGWPDQRPITKDLVASRLTPPPAAHDTVLATITLADQLTGWGALRPAPPGGTARLWGPIIHPDAQQRGLGHQLLDALTNTTAFTHCHDHLTTAEIPSQRAAAHAFFASAGWQACGRATLLHARPIPRPAPPNDTALTVGTSAPNSPALAGDLARLYQATNPRHSDTVAAATLQRWSTDRRWRPDHLLVAHDPSGHLAGAVLLYPLAHVDDSEPPEVLLADVLLDTPWQDPATLAHVVGAALNHAADLHPESVLRAITRHKALAEALVSFGAVVTDDILYYATSRKS